jgi:hypothetical protein
MLCNTTIIRYLNKPTQSKTQLTQEVVNSFNTYYTHTDGLMMKIASNANWCEAGTIHGSTVPLLNIKAQSIKAQLYPYHVRHIGL